MNTSKLSLAALLVLGAAAVGCTPSVEADIPDVEVTQKGLSFEGVPLGGSLGEVSLSQSFTQQHSKLDLPSGLDAEVKALGVSLIAKTGIQDFSFLHSLRVTMSDDVHQPVELINYQMDPSAKASGELDMISANPVNTLDQWKRDSATFTVNVAGTLPPDAWTIDLKIRFGGSFKYKL